MNLIKLCNIEKTYFNGKISYHALKNINLEIERGEYTAILGPSGSGKSTLMHILGCLSTPTSGDYFLDGQKVSTMTRNQLANIRNKKIGFIFQSFNLLPYATALENVALPLTYRKGVANTERTKIATKLLEQFGLLNHAKHKPNELSGGQQQRVAIARALATNPDIILADEPTGNLDSKSANDVAEIFKELSAQNRTVILITHDLNIAKRTNRIIYIKDGEVTPYNGTEIL